MNLKKITAAVMIELILILPFYTSMVFAQPEQGGQEGQGLDAELPRYYNKRMIDIRGGVTPYSGVQLYVDGEYIRGLPGASTENGRFEFLSIELGDHGTTKAIRIRATDPAGATAQKDFMITVDMEMPMLSITEFPAQSIEQTINFKGSVNEESTINVYALPVIVDAVKPEKIYGLENTSMQANLVELEWHESNETDFDRYIIYRDDVGAIATASPADYNSYSDVLVNSNETYSYTVAAMDLAGNIGDQSDRLTVTMPPGGLTNVEKPAAIDPGKDKGLKETITISGDFDVELELGDDGTYTVRLEAVDNAGNKNTAENQTTLDTMPPTLEITNPRTGARIYETYAKEVDIEGATKPYTIIKLYVGGIKDKEDYSTISDSTGSFSFNNVDITTIFRGSLEPEWVGVGELETRYPLTEEERRNARATNVYFVAEDAFGRTANASVIYNIVTCWEGEFDWDARPLLEYQSPTLLSVERLAEGTEAIYFFFNFTYLGGGTDPQIESINFQKACDDYIMRQPSYNISCQVMPSSCTAKPNDDKTMWYIACELGRYEGFNDYLEEGWEDFFAAINNEMIFPFKIMLRYSHMKGINRTSEFQTFCKPVTYVVDSSKVDFRDVLPDFLLYDTVEALNETLATLAEWQKAIRDVLEYLGIGCMVGFGLRTIAVIYRRFVCFWEGFQETTQEMFEQKPEEEKEEGEEACPADQNKRNLLSDEHLERDCGQCHSAWNFEAKTYMFYRTLCDRVFCHDAPARWTEKKPDTELFNKAVLEVSQCSDDDRGLLGQPFTPQKCSGWPEDSLDQSVINENNAGDTCYQVFVVHSGNRIDSRVFVKKKDTEVGNTGIHQFTSVSRQSARSAITESVSFYGKQVEGSRKESYYTANTDTCEKICGEGQPLCITSRECLALNAPEDSPLKTESIQSINQGLAAEHRLSDEKTYSSKRSGYTMDCVFGNGEKVPNGQNYMNTQPNSDFQGDSLENTRECCCVYESDKPPSEYYQTNDYGIETDKDTKYPVWSYRYGNIGFKTGPKKSDGSPPEDSKRTHTKYHPDRYIKERDWSGCFGMNHLLDLKGGSKLKLDPFKDHIATFQCFCISGIYNRLQLISNMLAALQNCLITVRTTGTADAGVCEELFSQYVCSLIWYIISYLQTGCLPWGGKGIDLSAQNGTVTNAVRGGVGALFGGIAESAAGLASDYGNAQLNNLIGVGEGAIVRKVCMAAFGFDWDFDIEDILDAAYATPYATFVQAVAPTREYLTYDPTNGQSKYEYRASWLINPGCDIENYNVYLSCVSRNEMDRYPGINCDGVNDPEGINCDCINLDGEQTRLFYDGRGLSQSVLEDTNKHDIITSLNRYDHLKFVLRAGHDVPADIREKCFPEGHEDGVFYFPIRDRTARDILACYVDITTGVFTCLPGLPFFETKGTGYFVDLKLNGQDADGFDEIGLHEKLTLSPTIWRAEGPDLCLYTEWMQEGGRKNEFLSPVEMAGTQEYPPIIIDSDTGISGVSFYRVTPSIAGGGLHPSTLRPEPDATLNPGDTMTVFFYDEKEDSTIEISRTSTDKVKIAGPGSDYVEIGTSDYWIRDAAGDRFVLRKEGIAFQVTHVTLPPGAREIGFTIRTEQSATTARQATKTLKVSLVRLKEGLERYTSAADCNKADKVRYQNQVQEKPFSIVVKHGTEGRCAGDGTRPVASQCRCAPGAPVDDCGKPDDDMKYCYANRVEGRLINKSCHAWPRCPTGDVRGLGNNIACDCDEDGAINDIVDLDQIRAMTDLCEGGSEAYCWDSDNDSIRECHDEAQPSAEPGAEEGAAPAAEEGAAAAAEEEEEPPRPDYPKIKFDCSNDWAYIVLEQSPDRREIYFEDDQDANYYQIRVEESGWNSEVAKFYYDTGKFEFTIEAKGGVKSSERPGIIELCSVLHRESIVDYGGIESVPPGLTDHTYYQYFGHCDEHTQKVTGWIEITNNNPNKVSQCSSAWG